MFFLRHKNASLNVPQFNYKALKCLKKWLKETTEVVTDVEHGDSSTHECIFAGRLQLQTSLTLPL